MNQINLKIVAFVGMAGSGKSTAVDYLSEKAYPRVHFGEVIYRILDEKGLEYNQKNERRIREEIRANEGMGAVANRIALQIDKLVDSGQHRIVADGLYGWEEYKVLKHKFPGSMIVIAMVSPKHERYKRLVKRKIRPLNETQAQDRDWAEIENSEKGGPIAIADYYIMNDGDISGIYQQLDNILIQNNFYN